MTALLSLNDPTLFGNDAAEDEDEEVFLSYVVDRKELASFTNPAQQFVVAHAYKGEGKSALLRLATVRLQQAAPGGLVLTTTGGDLWGSFTTDSATAYNDHVRHWKRALFDLIAREVGARLTVAWSDDAMSLVEEAEKTGFRSKSFIGSILSRLKVKAKVPHGELELTTRGAASTEKLVERWVKDPVWLFVDDVDKNFQAAPDDEQRIAAFFDACRSLTKTVPELRVRSVVRPNVWTLLKMKFESLSHVQQYVVELGWNEDDMLELLAKRIAGYFSRTGQHEHVAGKKPRDLVALAFADPMPWGSRSRPPHVVLHTLAKHRPRWAIELSKAAARWTADREQPLIGIEAIAKQMDEFGNRRIQDTIAEFRAQCEQIEDLIVAFRGTSEEFSTSELLTIITNKITNHCHVRIAGGLGRATARDIASFLLQIGFFFGREELPGGSYRHVTYSERPHLFRSTTSTDDGLRWEIHPVYRQALDLRDEIGRAT